MEANSATAALKDQISELTFQLDQVYREKLILERELLASLKKIAGLKASLAEIATAVAGLQLAIAHGKIKDLEVGFLKIIMCLLKKNKN